MFIYLFRELFYFFNLNKIIFKNKKPKEKLNFKNRGFKGNFKI